MKKLLLGLALVLVLVVAVAAAAPFFVDLNRYKDRITALAEEKTGREIKVERIELTVLTGLGFMLRGVEVGGSEKHPEPLLKVGEFQVRVAFWPLLAGNIQIAELALTGPEIRVRREADGAFSFDDILARFKSAPSEGAEGGAVPAEKPKEKAPSALLAGLLVRDLSIQGGLLSYRDASIRPGETLVAELRNLMVSIEDFALDRAAPVSIAFSTPEGESVGLKGKIGPIPESLDAKAIKLDMAVELTDLQLARWAKWAPKAPVAVHGGKLSTDLTLDGSLAGGLSTKGTIALAGLAITDAKGKKIGPLDLTTDHDLSVALDKEAVRIRKGVFTVSGAPIQAVGEVSGWSRDLAMDLAVKTEGAPIAKWAKWAGKTPVAIDGGALTTDMKLKGSMKTSLASAGTLRLAGLAITNKDGKKFGPVDLASDHDLSVALEDESVRIKKGRFTVAGVPLEATGSVANWSKALALDLAASAKDAPTEKLLALAPAGTLPKDAKLSGPLTLSARLKGPMKALAVDADADLSAMAVAYGDQFSKPAGTPLRLAFAGDLGEDRLGIRASKLTLGGSAVDASGAVAPLSETKLDMKIAAPGLDLAALAEMLPALRKFAPKGTVSVATAVKGSPKKLEALRLEGAGKLAGVGATVEGAPKPISDLAADLKFAGDVVEVANGTFAMGANRFAIAAKSKGFKNPTIDYTVTSPEVKVAELMPPAKDAKKTDKPQVLKEVKAEGSVAVAEGGPVVRNRLTASEASYAGADVRDLDTRVRFANKVVTLEDVTFSAYEGAWRQSGTVDLRDPAKPAWNTTQSFLGFKTDPMLTAFAKAPESLFGTGGLTLSLAGAGKEKDAVLSSLSGKGTLDIKPGMVGGENLVARLVDQLEGKLKGVPVVGQAVSLGGLKSYLKPEDLGLGKSGKGTEFEALESVYEIQGNRLDFSKLSLSTTPWTMNLKGSAGLDKKISFAGEFAFSEGKTRDLVEKNKNLRFLVQNGRLTFPIGLAGSLGAIVPTLNLTQEFFNKAAENAARLAVEEQLGRGLDRGLDRLLGGKKGAEPSPAPAPAPAPGEAQPAPVPAPAPEKTQPEKPKDAAKELGKDILRDLLKPR